MKSDSRREEAQGKFLSREPWRRATSLMERAGSRISIAIVVAVVISALFTGG
jgi:hypothetical protein